MRINKEDRIRLRLAGSSDEWSAGVVVLASESGSQQSVAVMLADGVRTKDGFILGMIPLTIDYEARTIESLLGDRYEIETMSDRQSTYCERGD